MSEVLECYRSIVGMTQKRDCIAGYKEEYSESKSNLFLDELQGIVLNYTCGEDVWGMLDRSLVNAWQSFRNDISMAGGVRPKRRQSSGDIGAIQFQTLIASKNYAGVRLFSNITGGSLILRGVTIMPSFTGNTVVRVYDDFEELYSQSVSIQNKKPCRIQFDDALTLPLSGNYYIFYETNGTVYRNKLLCSSCTGTRWCFDINKPCYSQSRDFWTEWIMAAGVTFDGIDSRGLAPRNSKFMGLVLHGNFMCDEGRVLCDEASDFINNQTDRAIAFALRYKWGEMFLNEVVGSGDVNRWTLQGHEVIVQNVGYYQERYKELVDFIVDNIDLSKTDCFVCHPKYRMANSMGVQWT